MKKPFNVAILSVCRCRQDIQTGDALMNILNIEHISKIYGEKVIFDDVSLGIQEGDKAGIIGINGRESPPC